LWGKRLKLLLLWERGVIALAGISVLSDIANWIAKAATAQQQPTNNTTDLEGA
jgi:hypothetical protein